MPELAWLSAFRVEYSLRGGKRCAGSAMPALFAEMPRRFARQGTHPGERFRTVSRAHREFPYRLRRSARASEPASCRPKHGHNTVRRESSKPWTTILKSITIRRIRTAAKGSLTFRGSAYGFRCHQRLAVVLPPPISSGSTCPRIGVRGSFLRNPRLEGRSASLDEAWWGRCAVLDFDRPNPSNPHSL